MQHARLDGRLRDEGALAVVAAVAAFDLAQRELGEWNRHRVGMSASARHPVEGSHLDRDGSAERSDRSAIASVWAGATCRRDG